VRACVVPADLAVDLDMMADMSEPVAQAYLDALALCETESAGFTIRSGSFGNAIDRSWNCDGTRSGRRSYGRLREGGSSRAANEAQNRGWASAPSSSSNRRTVSPTGCRRRGWVFASDAP